MSKILIVEDEVAIAELEKDYLELEQQLLITDTKFSACLFVISYILYITKLWKLIVI